MAKIKAKSPPKQGGGNTIANCMLVGVQYDATAVVAISTIADGLVENAKALGKLAEVLRASNVHIESMIKIDGK